MKETYAQTSIQRAREFVDALRLSHFEATDLPIQHEGFSSEVDVSSIWSI